MKKEKEHKKKKPLKSFVTTKTRINPDGTKEKVKVHHTSVGFGYKGHKNKMLNKYGIKRAK